MSIDDEISIHIPPNGQIDTASLMKNASGSMVLKTLFAAALVTATGLNSAKATLVVNANFDSDAVGGAPVTSNNTTAPITHPFSIGGYSAPPNDQGDTPPTAGEGTIIVNTSHASLWTTNAANNEVGALYMDTEYSQSTSTLSVAFDLSVLHGSTTTDQSSILNGSPVFLLFGVNTFTPGGAIAFRFNAAATSDTGGVFGFRNASGLTPFFSYTNDTDYHIELDANYTTGKVSASVNGISVFADYSFSAGSVTPVTAAETFLYLNGHTGDANSVTVDNILVSTDSPLPAIPEPTTALFGAALLGVVGLNRRRNNGIPADIK